MGYNNLSESAMTDDARAREAERILYLMRDVSMERVTVKEWAFMCDMKTASFISTKQLFWLRDLKDKYL